MRGRPALLVTPMPVLTPSRLQTLSSQPLLKNYWHFLSAAVLGACNLPDEVPVLYKYAMDHSGPKDHAMITAKMRESIMKSTALIGLPRVINSLTELKNVTPKHLRATTLSRDNKMDYSKEGKEFFSKVYTKITKRVRTQMWNAYPDLDWYAQNFVYGPLLSSTRILSPKETCLCVVATLVPLDVNPQLKGHLKGAVNNGATPEEVNAARDLALSIAEWAGMHWKTSVAKL